MSFDSLQQYLARRQRTTQARVRVGQVANLSLNVG